MENEITVTPDTYVPFVNDKGEYIDRIPPIINGIRCQCSSSTKVYGTSAKFRTHMKTKKHKEWLIHLSENRGNYFGQCIRNEELLNQQKLIIARLENENFKNTQTIHYLTEQLTKKYTTNQSVDLLDIN